MISTRPLDAVALELVPPVIAVVAVDAISPEATLTLPVNADAATMKMCAST